MRFQALPGLWRSPTQQQTRLCSCCSTWNGRRVGPVPRIVYSAREWRAPTRQLSIAQDVPPTPRRLRPIADVMRRCNALQRGRKPRSRRIRRRNATQNNARPSLIDNMPATKLRNQSKTPEAFTPLLTWCGENDVASPINHKQLSCRHQIAHKRQCWSCTAVQVTTRWSCVS